MPASTDHTPTTFTARLDTLAFRTRHSWWAPWAATTQGAFLAAFAYTAPTGDPGLALAPYAIAGLALANPRVLRDRVWPGTRLLPAALRARRAYTEHLDTPPGAVLWQDTSRARRAWTGTTRQAPRIARVEALPGGGITLYAENLPAITLDAWEQTAPALARRLRHAPPAITETDDGRLVRLDFPPHGAAPATAAPALPKRTAGLPNMRERHPLTAVPVARRENGAPYLLPIEGGHTLVIGYTGSGKGSVLWAAIRGMLPQIHDGTVQLWGADPKRGMELGIGRELFSRLVAKTPDRDEDITVMLEDAVRLMRERGDRIYDARERKFTASREEPLVVVIFDEFLMMGTFRKECRVRSWAAIAELVSQGRAGGVSVMALAQVAQKSVIGGPLRDLFPNRICLRVPSAMQTNMCLGDQAATLAGALSHEIPDDKQHQGVGYVIDGDSGGRAIRVRFDFTDDATIEAMAERWPAPAARASGGGIVVGEIIRHNEGGEGGEELEGHTAKNAERPPLTHDTPAPDTTNRDTDPQPEPAPTAEEKCLAALHEWPPDAPAPTVRALAKTAGVSVGTAGPVLKKWRAGAFSQGVHSGRSADSLRRNFVPGSDPTEHTKCTSSRNTQSPGEEPDQAPGDPLASGWASSALAVWGDRP